MQDCVCLQYVSIVFRAYKSRSKAFTEHVVNWVQWTVFMWLTASQCLSVECQLSSPHREIKASPHFLVSLWGVVMRVCVRERERQSKPVWSDKLEFNWLWWGYRVDMRRRTDEEQRWFPFLLSSFTVLTEWSVDRLGWHLSLWTTAVCVGLNYGL